jgi:hypothetical protein
MAEPMRRWRLAEWINLEAELADGVGVSAAEKAAVAQATEGLEGTAARRAGIEAWWNLRREEMGPGGPGAGFQQALSGVTVGLSLITLLAGGSAVLGMVDTARSGVNVVIFLGVVLGLQWLMLLVAGTALIVRRNGGGLGTAPAWLAWLARRLAGGAGSKWWQAVIASSGLRSMLGWRLLRGTQVAAVMFNVGILAMLGGLVMARHVGFFWETTTEGAMRGVLETAVRWLSLPWAAGMPAAVPDATVIDASRWLPERTGSLEPGPAEWWRFLLVATFFWGLLPRVLLWALAWRGERNAVAKMEFQGRAHRELWRALRDVALEPPSEAAADAALVLDVGGAGFDPAALRPFLLRRLRVNPAAWLPVAVLDPGAEGEAQRALSRAPAGVVLLAEAWALSPPRMVTLHAAIRQRCGPELPIFFLVANAQPDGLPIPPAEEEARQWERFVDGLHDPAAEVFAFTENA